MNRLQLLASLDDTDFAVRDAVHDLEFTWGHPPRLRSIAERVGLSEQDTAERLRRLACIGYVLWWADDGVAWNCSGVPIVGAAS